jgi:hypothetical protein
MGREREFQLSRAVQKQSHRRKLNRPDNKHSRDQFDFHRHKFSRQRAKILPHQRGTMICAVLAPQF